MQTIPIAWKIESSRNEWLNQVGIPVLYFRITYAGTGAKARLTTYAGMFKEEGGAPWQYDGSHVITISTIDEQLHMLQGKAGGASSVSSLDITIANGEVDGERFSDQYPLDDLLHATVETWLCFKGIDQSIANSIQLPRGRIENWRMEGDQIVLGVAEYSLLKELEIPPRVIDFSNAKSPGWNQLHQYQYANIVPFTFGNTLGPAVDCDVPTAYSRGTRFVYGYPTPYVVKVLHRLYFWDESAKRLWQVRNDLVSATSSTDLYIHAYLTDLYALPEVGRGVTRISPSSVWEDPYLAGGNHLSINDNDLSTEEEGNWVLMESDVAYVYDGNLALTTWEKIWEIGFKRDDFPEGVVFNIYAVADITAAGATSNGEVVVRIMWEGNNFYTTPTYIPTSKYTLDVAGSGGAVGMAAFATWKDFIPHDSYRRNCSEVLISQLALALAMTKEDLPESPAFDIKTYRTATAEAVYYHQHEHYCLILPRTPIVPYYAKGNFGYGTIQACIDAIFDSHLELDSSTWLDYVNFARDYEVAGSIHERKPSYEHLSDLVQEIGALLIEQADGTVTIVDINGKSSDYDISDSDILRDGNGVLQLSVSKSEEKLYSRFAVDFEYFMPAKQYRNTKYVDKDDHNLAYVDADDLQDYCEDAATNYGTDKQLVLQCKFVRNARVAEEILTKLVKQYSKRLTRIRFTTSLRLIDLERGDQVTFTSTDYSSDNNFWVIGKRVNYSADPPTIEFELLESLFGTAGMGQKTGPVKSTMAIKSYIASNLKEV